MNGEMIQKMIENECQSLAQSLIERSQDLAVAFEEAIEKTEGKSVTYPVSVTIKLHREKDGTLGTSSIASFSSKVQISNPKHEYAADGQPELWDEPGGDEEPEDDNGAEE